MAGHGWAWLGMAWPVPTCSATEGTEAIVFFWVLNYVECVNIFHFEHGNHVQNFDG